MRWLALGFIYSRTLCGEISFVFDYSGSTEFNESGLGAVRRASLEEAASELGAIFDHNATIQIKVDSENNPNSLTLASAASEPIEVANSFFGYAPDVVMKKILTGVDDNGSTYDGTVEVNFGLPWDFDDNVSESSFDFQATMIHELIHALGFASLIFFDGTDVFGTSPGNPGVWGVFDDFLSNQAGLPLIDDSSFALNSSRWSAVRQGGTPGGIFFNGPQAVAANGSPVAIYSPNSWEEGSSGSHLDDDDPVLNRLLMLAATSTGPYRRSVSRVERAILRDLGYAVFEVANPELEVVSLEPDNSVQLRLTGQQDTQHVIESSGSLEPPIWTERGTAFLSFEDPSETVTISLTGLGAPVFFRAREVPTTDPAARGSKSKSAKPKWRR